MIEEFILVNKVDAKLINNEKEQSSVINLGKSMNISRKLLVNTFLFVEEKTFEPVIAIFEADAVLSIDKLQKASGLDKLREASQVESLEITGYAAEFIPPVSVYGVKTFLSESALKIKKVYAGAGDKFHLLEINPGQIKEFGFEVQTADLIE